MKKKSPSKSDADNLYFSPKHSTSERFTGKDLNKNEEYLLIELRGRYRISERVGSG